METVFGFVVSYINVDISLCVLCMCGHELCYCCGAEYREGQHSCTCDTFNSMPRVMDAYSEQERSQLALIQRFLVGDWILKHETFFVSGSVVDGREMTVQFHETFLCI